MNAKASSRLAACDASRLSKLGQFSVARRALYKHARTDAHTPVNRARCFLSLSHLHGLLHLFHIPLVIHLSLSTRGHEVADLSVFCAVLAPGAVLSGGALDFD